MVVRRWLHGAAFWMWVGLAGLYVAAAAVVVWVDLSAGEQVTAQAVVPGASEVGSP